MARWLIFIYLCVASNALAVDVQLAKTYQAQQVNLSEFYMSEKLDGIRAVWQNGILTTRQGNKIHVPTWFTKDFPNSWLDGELYIAPNQFQRVASIVLDKEPDHAAWQEVRFYIFDAPDHQNTFAQRYTNYQAYCEQSPYLNAITQYPVRDDAALDSFYQAVLEKQGEGVILHKRDAQFTAGRSANVLKVKPFLDSEAEVIAIVPGKGKYQGMMGALLVRWQQHQFKIGTGFSDLDRQFPPAIGSQISFRYSGLTDKGLPRFARYLRVRPAE
jgi:DNA ligase-1